MPTPSSDSPKSDPPSGSPITAPASTSPASTSGLRRPPEFDFDFDGFLTSESPSLLNETWFLVDREIAAPSIGGLDDQGTGLKVLDVDEKVEKVNIFKEPNSGMSENASVTIQDRSRTDSASYGSKGKAVLFESSERRGSDGPKLFWNWEAEKILVKRALDSLVHEDDDDKIGKDGAGGESSSRSSAKRIREACRECGQDESLSIDAMDLDFENETQNTTTSYTVKNDFMNLDDCLQLDSDGDDESGAREMVGDNENGTVTADLNEGPNCDDTGDGGRRRFSREEKGKAAMDNGDLFPDVFHGFDLGLEPESINVIVNENFGAPRIAHNVNVAASPKTHNANVALRDREEQWRIAYIRRKAAERRELMENFKDIAKINASRFARISPAQDDNHASPKANVENEIEEWSGPFSTAMKSIRSRDMKSRKTGCNSSESLPASIDWVPRSNQEQLCARASAPSLQELCLDSLAKNSDAIVSLENVPDALKHKLCQLVCDSRNMDIHFLELLLTGSPTEIRLTDCSWMSEEQFTKAFQSCDTTNLMVLQLDQCGRCTPDHVVLATLGRSPDQLLRLTSLSLRGACRLSDRGLCGLVSCTPALRSINLSQCSLLTSASVDVLVDALGSLLKELYLDDCHSINVELVGPQLQKLEHLEVLSVAGIQTVSDDFISNFVIERGHNLKELVLKDCEKLTDSSAKIIAEFCPGLCSLDLMNLCKLTDSSIGYLANGCRALHTLRLCRNPFSDEAIAAFLETTGVYLEELSLNNVKKVGHHTALSLGSRAKKLHTLDLSWCRNFTDHHLGFIVDSCPSLRLLKLFGCTQITQVSLFGHSNPEVRIIGCKMAPLLQHVNVADPQRLGALRYSPPT